MLPSVRGAGEVRYCGALPSFRALLAHAYGGIEGGWRVGLCAECHGGVASAAIFDTNAAEHARIIREKADHWFIARYRIHLAANPRYPEAVNLIVPPRAHINIVPGSHMHDVDCRLCFRVIEIAELPEPHMRARLDAHRIMLAPPGQMPLALCKSEEEKHSQYGHRYHYAAANDPAPRRPSTPCLGL